MLDSLGVIIGFSTVMLLLSLAVTALSQATGSLLRVRMRMLERGLRQVFRYCGIDEHDAKARELLLLAAGEKPPNKALSRGAAANDASAETASAETGADGGATDVGKEPLPMKGLPVSFIHAGEIAQLVELGGMKLDEEQKKNVITWYGLLEARRKSDFLAVMRLVSLGWAAALAIYLQVDALDLLHRLSLEQKVRSAAVALSEGVHTAARTQEQTLLALSGSSKDVLATLAKENPDVQTVLATVDTGGSSKAEILAQFAVAVAQLPPERAAALTKAYREALDQALEKERRGGLLVAGQALGQLDALAIGPQFRKPGFYGDLNAWLGMLLTIILLSLGAPFWYRVLGSFLNLKDVFETAAGRRQGGGASKAATPGQ